MTQPDLFAGIVNELRQAKARRMRDAAIQTATEHADDVCPSWSDVAFEYVKTYARQHATLTAEQVRAFAESRGFPHPPDPRAWGGIMVRASRRGIVTKGGEDESMNPAAHCRPVRLWNSTSFGAAK